MSFKKEINRIIERFTGARTRRPTRRGIDPFADIRMHLPQLRLNVVFDVGANTGQSAQNYLKAWPGSEIYCFEPVEKTFLQLQRTVHRNNNVHCYKLALAARNGSGRMVLEGTSDMFFLLRDSRPPANGNQRIEEVNLETVDRFCHDHGIDRINYLKIDTEGGDLDVLKGATGLLMRQGIDVVQVEAGMNGRNKLHVPFHEFSAFFEPKNYFLFGVYEQVNEFLTNQPNLRRSNPIFISESLIKANTSG